MQSFKSEGERNEEFLLNLHYMLKAEEIQKIFISALSISQIMIS